MSKITVIGGDLIEEVGGSYKIYAKGGYEITSGKEIIFNAKGGIKYGTALSPPPPEVEAKCIVHFRPKNWKGEYGFCWFREKNKEISDSEEYEKLVGKYYQFSDKEMSKLNDTEINAILTKYYTEKERKVFDDEKNGSSPYSAYYISDDNVWYKKRSNVKRTTDSKGKVNETHEQDVIETIHNFKNDPQYNTESDSLERLKSEYAIFQYPKMGKKNTVENIVYHGSYITLFPQTANYGRYNADIELNISVIEKDATPDYLFFKVDGMPLKEDHPNIGIDRLKIVKPKGKELIKIACKTNTSFTEDKKIEIYAVKGNSPEVLAGCITMIAPIIKELNVVTIGVKTKEGKFDPGKPIDNWLDFYRKSLGQALIKVNIIDKNSKKQPIQIDISDTPNFKKEFGADDDGNITKTYGFAYTMYQKFKTSYPEYAEGYFKLYFVDVRNLKKGEDGGETLGYSDNDDNWGVMFSTHKTQTIAHETLHALGLPHSFFYRKNSYVYKAMATYNIMDYSHLSADPVTGESHSSKDRYYTWKWQWEVVRNSDAFVK
ncbi:hypothetical protein [Elizabethkingia meningoseptica]|uniref:hypothetical protein n=1 Tax=Elizabethkingia meningoseptica TaxID=238 RepID=UPI0038919DED